MKFIEPITKNQIIVSPYPEGWVVYQSAVVYIDGSMGVACYLHPDLQWHSDKWFYLYAHQALECIESYLKRCNNKGKKVVKMTENKMVDLVNAL